jgi:predicted lipid carrier protein YhbT
MFTLSFRHDFRVPDVISSALRPLPLLPLQVVLQQFASSIISRHPDIPERIGRSHVLFGIEPVDVPFVIEIALRDGAVKVRLLRAFDGAGPDARITGTLAALMGLVDGKADGDALFFSREISVTGDIAAVLALRNAVDAAEISLMREAAALIESWVIRPAGLFRGKTQTEELRGADAGGDRPNR